MALATMELLCTTPISAYGIYINIADNPLEPWKGFSDAHFNYSRVGQYPSVIWRLNRLSIVSTELTRWSLVFCAFSFFAFFGFADEARKNYRKTFWAIAKIFGFPPPLPAGAIKYVPLLQIEWPGFLNSYSQRSLTAPCYPNKEPSPIVTSLLCCVKSFRQVFFRINTRYQS